MIHQPISEFHFTRSREWRSSCGDRLVDLINRSIWDYADKQVVVNQRVEKQPWRMAEQEQAPGQ